MLFVLRLDGLATGQVERLVGVAQVLLEGARLPAVGRLKAPEGLGAARRVRVPELGEISRRCFWDNYPLSFFLFFFFGGVRLI